MKNELQSVQDIPISVREYSVTAYRDHFVVKTREARTFLFVDPEELDLLETLKTPSTVASLLQIYHQRHGKYSYQKVFDLIFRLLHNSFLRAESETALLKHAIFKTFAPEQKKQFFVPLKFEGLGRAIGPLARFIDRIPALCAMAAAVCGSAYFLETHAGRFEFFAVTGSHARGLLLWILSFAAIASMRNGMKYFLLKSKGLEAPRAGIGFRGGIPVYTVDDSDILTLGWGATLRFHMASLLFPSVPAVLAILLFRLNPIPAAGIPILASLLILFLDLSPFLRGELLQALDRLSGKYHLLDSLKQFVRRKFMSRMFSFRSTFEFETHLIGYGIFAVLWMYSAYRMVSFASARHLGRLIDVIILSETLTERIAAAGFVCAILFPLLVILGLILQLIGVNLYGFFEKPVDRLRNRMAYYIHRFHSTTATEITEFIGSIPLFAGLPSESRAKLAGYMQVEYFAKNRAVVWQGEEGDAFYIIYRGDAEVLHEEQSGVQTSVAHLSSKDSFGEIALLKHSPRTATVKARTPLICFVLRKFFFQRFIEENMDQRDHITRIIRMSAFLKELPMFADVPPEVMSRVILEIQERAVPKGDTLIKEGDAADEFFILRSGSAAVWKNYGAPSQKQIAKLSAGDYFGEIALFEETARSATVTALDDSTVLVMPKPSFFHILRTNVISGMWIEETIRKRKKKMERAT